MDVDVRNYPLLVLCFRMDGCPACEEFLPVLRKVSQRHPDVPTFATDANKNSEAADTYRVTVAPTTLLLANGRQVGRLEGGQSEDIVERLFLKAKREG